MNEAKFREAVLSTLELLTRELNKLRKKQVSDKLNLAEYMEARQ